MVSTFFPNATKPSKQLCLRQHRLHQQKQRSNALLPPSSNGPQHRTFGKEVVNAVFSTAAIHRRTPCACSSWTGQHELRYNGSGCTVELITERGKKMIKFTTGVRSEGTGCLDDCDGKVAHFKHGFSNLLPFAYSRTKKELEKLNEGPDSEATGCGDEGLCGCMSQTFLEVSWSTCSGYIYAHTHLIGEVKQGLSHERRFGSGDEEFNFNLTTKKSEFTMDFDKAGETNFNSMNKPISCVPNKANAIVGPKTWKIKNIMKGKYLLVFHLLSKSATREFKDNKVDKEQQPKEEAPKCDLFVRFTRPEYEFLYVGPPTTTTVTTTTTTTTTPAIIPSSSTTGIHQGSTKVQEVKGLEKKSGSGIVIIVIVCVVLVVVLGIGFLIYFITKKEENQPETKQSETKAGPVQSSRVGEDEMQKQFWSKLGNEEQIRTKNLPSLEEQFVTEIFDRMEGDDGLNCRDALFELYLPELKEKGFATVGTFNEWGMKNGMNKRDDEFWEDYVRRIKKAKVQRKATEGAKEYLEAEESKNYYKSNAENDGVKKTPKDSTPKKKTSKTPQGKKKTGKK
uniref:Uncharacterized protein n=1 Tax=Meloidogyne hapla TaxID=6305 RepID=A0A1I8B2A5_MELHA